MRRRRAQHGALELVARPALEEVADELNTHGLVTPVREAPSRRGPAGVELLTDLGDDPGFVYRLTACPSNAPTYAVGRLSGEVYYRTEVHLAGAARATASTATPTTRWWATPDRSPAVSGASSSGRGPVSRAERGRRAWGAGV